jgi:hypothetical protein
MNYGMNVRPERIDGAVHRELGRGAALIAAKLVAVDVNQHEHVFGHPALADHRRRREDVAVVKPRADIAIGSRNKAELVDAAAYLNDLLSEFALSLHSLTVIKQKVIGMFALLAQSHWLLIAPQSVTCYPPSCQAPHQIAVLCSRPT